MSTAAVAFHAVPSPTLFPQTYDNALRLNATTSILDHGDTSGLYLRALTGPMQRFAVYPAAWHAAAAAVVQLTGASLPTAFNAVAIAVSACVWLPGIA